jgi:tetratricopeptide (TPR) repeat protein
MTRARNAALILLCVFFAASAAAQPKGNARINGKILDDQGKPAQAVAVRAVKAGDPQIMEAKTNDKGEWQIAGLTEGQWNLEFVKEGFDSQRMTVEVSGNRNPPIDMKLTKAAPAVDPNAELQAEMQKAVELQKAGKLPEARKVIADLIAKYPSAYRLNAFIATTYEGEKNFDKAIEHMLIVVEKEPADLDMKMFLAELYTQKGSRDEAQKILAGIDMTQVKDPTLFINMAIGSINAGKADDAIATLDMVAKQFPQQSNVLYYRARAYIVAKKMAEATADLEKFVSIAPPDARELPDAKKLLEQLKAIK